MRIDKQESGDLHRALFLSLRLPSDEAIELEQHQYSNMRQNVPHHNPLHCPYCELNGNRDDHFYYVGRLFLLCPS